MHLRIKRPRAFFSILLLMLYICTTSFWQYIYFSSIVRYGSIVLSLLLALLAAKRPNIKKGDAIFILTLLFVLINNRNIANGDLYYFWVYLICTVIYLTFKDDLDVISLAFNIFFIAGLIYSLFTFICYLSPTFYFNRIFPIFSAESQNKLMISYNRGAVAGIAKHYSLNAFYITMGILAAISKVFTGSAKVEKRWIIAIGVMTVALLLTGKRGHIVFGIAAVLVLYYYYNENKKHGRLFKVIGLVVVIIITFVVLRDFIPGVNLFVERFIETAENNNITMGRNILYVVALQLFKENPIFGIGWGGFVYEYYRIASSVFAVHNIYISLLCETGIVGLSVFLIWFVKNMVETIKLYIQIRRGGNVDNKIMYLMNMALVYQVFFILLGITENPLYDVETIVPYFLSIIVVKMVSRAARGNNA